MTSRIAGVWTSACLAFSVLTGCNDNVTDPPLLPPPPPPPDLVRVEPQVLRLSERQTFQLQATVAPELNGKPISWSSTNPLVAAVSSTGVVLGGQTGSALITARVGEASGSSIVTVGRLFAECRKRRCRAEGWERERGKREGGMAGLPPTSGGGLGRLSGRTPGIRVWIASGVF